MKVYVSFRAELLFSLASAVRAAILLVPKYAFLEDASPFIIRASLILSLPFFFVHAVSVLKLNASVMKFSSAFSL